MASQAPAKRRQQPDRAVKTSTSRVQKEQLAKDKFVRYLRKLGNGLLRLQSSGIHLKIAQRNQKESPFLQLPPEIRNRIYEYALGGRRFDVIFDTSAAEDKMEDDPHELALLSVCRQIYTETATLPFQLNTFGFEMNLYCYIWIQLLLPAQKEAIQAVRLRSARVERPLRFKGRGLKRAFAERPLVFRGRGLWVPVLRQLPSLKRVYVSTERPWNEVEKEKSTRRILGIVDKEVQVVFEVLEE